jgi:hypothetical protein
LASPTGRRFIDKRIHFYRVVGDEIMKRWGRCDDLGIMQQLGLIQTDPDGTDSSRPGLER